MKFESQAPKPLISAGKHVLTLVSVEKENVKSKFSKAPDGMVDKIMWSFTSNIYDNDTNEAFTYNVWTDLIYGDDRASLTGLLDQLLPDSTVKEKGNIRYEDLIGRKYDALIKRTKDGKKVYANHVYITPVE